MPVRSIFASVVLALLLSACATSHSQSVEHEENEENEMVIDRASEFRKMDGVSLEAPSIPMGPEEMKELTELGADHVALMPYAFTRGGSPDIIRSGVETQWWGETDTGIRACVDMAHEAGLEVMIKPHLWLGRGTFTGHVTFYTDGEWERWEHSYTDYILHYAELAEEKEVELICIGTELGTHIKERPEYWKFLIDTVRSVCSSRLTYAGNWDSYTVFPFWNELDYIGVDAYFPVSDEITPSVEECVSGWKRWTAEMKQLSDSLSTPVLFTEYGYRSMENCAARPWETSKGGTTDEIAQANALQALYSSVWQEDWMAGGYLWKWHARSHRDTTWQADRFTPQGKLAEEVVRRSYQ